MKARGGRLAKAVLPSSFQGNTDQFCGLTRTSLTCLLKNISTVFLWLIILIHFRMIFIIKL